MRKFFLLACCVAISANSIAQTLGTGLVAYYPFNNSTADVTPNHNDLSASGSIEFVNDRFGRANKAVSFSRNGNSYLSRPFFDYPDSISISYWQKPALDSEWAITVFNGSTFDGVGFIIDNYPTGGNTGPFLNFFAGGILKAGNAYVFKKNTWQHVVATIKNGDYVVYVNNSINAAGHLTTIPPSYFFTVGVAFDRTTYKAYYTGAIDDIRIYNRVLSPSEVSALYNETPLSTANISNTQPQIDIYPNPAAKFATIKFPNANAKGSVQLIDIAGHVLLQKVIDGTVMNIELPALKNGIYVARIDYNGDVVYRNITIQN